MLYINDISVVKLVILSVQCFESRMPSHCCKHTHSCYVVAYSGPVGRIGPGLAAGGLLGPCSSPVCVYVCVCIGVRVCLSVCVVLCWRLVRPTTTLSVRSCV